MRACTIVGAGDFSPAEFRLEPGSYVIAVDGGLRHLEALGIRPDLTIGDFDSLGYTPRKEDNVVVCPAEKDDTDMQLAVRRALETGFDRLCLYGGTGGGRFDHTLANLQTLASIARYGSEGFLFGDGWVMTAVEDGALRFPAGYEGYLSVFCHGDSAEGVFLTGLKYPLTDATLRCDNPLGVSNEFTGAPAGVAVKRGLLTVFWLGNLDKSLPERYTSPIIPHRGI